MKGLTVTTDDAKGFDFSAAASAVYKRLGQRSDLAVEVTFVGKDEIRLLNKTFRNVDRVTDVLSFPYIDGVRHEVVTKRKYSSEQDDDGNVLIGSVCICLDVAKEQAESFGHSLEREVIYLAVHGMLHCFGYDHETESDEKEMTSLAEEIMSSIGITREGAKA